MQQSAQRDTLSFLEFYIFQGMADGGGVMFILSLYQQQRPIYRLKIKEPENQRHRECVRHITQIRTPKS